MGTLLIFHIAVAFSSMAFVALTYVSPSKIKLFISYVLATSTLGSGIILTVQHPAHLVPACVMGLIYFGIVGVVIFASQRKFADIKINNDI